MSWFAAAVLAAALQSASAIEHEVHRRFLFVSSPSEKKIYMVSLPTLQELATYSPDRDKLEAKVLIDGVESKCEGALCTEDSDQGLVQPEGIAVWHGKDFATLFVADPGVEKIYSYSVYGTVDIETVQDHVSVGSQYKVVSGVPLAYGLALDGFGNLYYSTQDGTIGMIAADQLDKKGAAPKILYNSQAEKSISGPFALAADSFFVYWTNLVQGNSQGSVLKAFERDSAELKARYPDFPKVLAQNTPKAMGVCLSHQTVFYTAETQFLYAVKSDGGGIMEINGNFTMPRGCTYDGENTLYVADQAGFVYSLAANYQPMRNTTRVTEVVEIPAPTWLVVFTNAGYTATGRVTYESFST